MIAQGPRIAFFGRPGGENLLLWGPGKYKRKDWELMGGHRLWITRPGADEAEETYSPDNQSSDVSLDTTSFTVTAAMDPGHLTRRGFTITAVAPEQPERRKAPVSNELQKQTEVRDLMELIRTSTMWASDVES